MRKLALHRTHEIDGDFRLSVLNLLFVFQVNCPGCFIHGIPSVNQLVKRFQDRLSILGLSTSFEDFEWNTYEHTERLIHEQEVFGEVARYHQENEQFVVPNIRFPVAFDELVTGEEFAQYENVDFIWESNPNLWSRWSKSLFRERLIKHFLEQARVPKTFTLNQMKGTPTYLVFNDRYEILLEHFGPINIIGLAYWLEEKLRK